MLCPCGSEKPYKECCEPYHQGNSIPSDALSLMRSRYSAYALALSKYLIATTHPQNPRFEKDLEAWTKAILKFSHSTQFVGLEILEVVPKREKDGIASVTFRATLKQNGKDISFTERSYFKELDGKWYYLDGDVLG